MNKPLWTWLVPVLAIGTLFFGLAMGVGPWLALLCGAALVGAVLVAVHHAEVVAHRVGEPFGTLVLALAVTAIEAALILSMMLAGGRDMSVLPRDSIYAAVMIICNGVIGLCILVGGLAHREQTFRVEARRWPCGPHRFGNAHPRLAGVHDQQHAGRHLQHFAIGSLSRQPRRHARRFLSLCRRCVIATISFPRTTPANWTGACRAAHSGRNLDEFRTALARAGRRRGFGQVALAHDRASRRGGQCAPSRGRHRHRGNRPACPKRRRRLARLARIAFRPA